MATKGIETEEVTFTKTASGALLSSETLTRTEAKRAANKHPNYEIASSTQIDILDRKDKEIHEKLKHLFGIHTRDEAPKEKRLFKRGEDGKREYLHEGDFNNLPPTRQATIMDKYHWLEESERGEEHPGDLGGGDVCAKYTGPYSCRYFCVATSTSTPDGSYDYHAWLVLVPKDNPAKTNEDADVSVAQVVPHETTSILRVDQGRKVIIADASGKKFVELRAVNDAIAYVE